MNGPIYTQVLSPPPIVSQVGEQNTDAGGGSDTNMLLKNLLDVDGPFTLSEDGWLLSYIGATQHFHLTDPADLASILAPLVGALLDINDLADVNTSGVGNNYLLYYDSGTSTWKVRAPYALSDFVSGTPANGDEIRWSTSGTPHAEWFTPPAAPTTTFQGALIGTLVTYNNTSGQITSGASSLTVANSTPQYGQLRYQASLGSGSETTFKITVNGSLDIAQATSSALGGSGHFVVTSAVIPLTNGDVFTYSGGTMEQFSIQIW